MNHMLPCYEKGTATISAVVPFGVVLLFKVEQTLVDF